MASIFPFRAWRPNTNTVKKISCPPYDVINTKEARSLAKNKPQSFLHVIRPEIDLPVNTSFNHPSVYEQGAKNLKKFVAEQLLIQEPEPTLYLYQLGWKDKVQTGLFGCISVDEYDDEIILKHELTRPDKEDDRTKHILKQQAHAEPVMLTYKDHPDIQELSKKIMDKNKPVFDFKASDHVQHCLWKINEPEPFVQQFTEVEHLYIADGHHRCKSASRAAHRLRKKQPASSRKEAFNYFPAVIFPTSEMHILAYNRLVHTVPDNFMERLHTHFDVRTHAAPSPAKKGQISFYINKNWHGLALPVSKNPNSVEKLDAHRLQEFLLEPLLAIDDPRKNDNISFIGGIRGTEELEKRVDAGEAELAISMYPTGVNELITVSDDGLLMPPKSTWFEPKLRSGLLVHKF